MLRYYSYKGCGTCRKAKKWLTESAVEVEEIAIRETPPSIDELKLALKSGLTLKALFNSSGGDYRELGVKDLLPTLTEQEALEMLHSRGNLVKRPFLVSSKGALAGFKLAEWEQFFL
ncbi:MAG: Spx/MgsR family RNA polymerase-binding regulatory protein [Rubritalea sp.]|uniref:Spx/MgsR family RNA polymerase-binding regulatory protein n=1 Tax=Rubritalea sp. TaxID=2109375 RepID=UPI003242864A